MRPMFPGRALSRLENSEDGFKAGAALSSPLIPGTADDTLPNSSSVSRVFANAKSDPAPSLACVGVMESSFVNCPTSPEVDVLTYDTADV